MEMIKKTKEKLGKESKEKREKETLKQFKDRLDNYLANYLDNENERKEIIDKLVEFIKNNFSGENNDLTDERLLDLIKDKINEKKDLFIKKEYEKEFLDEEFWNIVKDFSIKSPEIKGNFLNDLETPEAVRSYLFLLLPDEEKNFFKDDFQRLITSKEDFDPNKFLKEIDSFIEDFMSGKKKQSLRFPKEWLPSELKEKYKDNLEEKLKKLGILNKGDKYLLILTPDKIQDMIYKIAESKLEISEQFKEIGEKILNIENLSKEAEKYLKSLPEGDSINLLYKGLFVSLKNAYKEGINMGMTEEEVKKLLDSLTKLENQYNLIIQRGKLVKNEKDKHNLLTKAKNWLKENGGYILGSIGLWGLAVGWFLPLWLINKMYSEIEKGPLMSKK